MREASHGVQRRLASREEAQQREVMSPHPVLLAPSIQAKAPANKERLIILGVDGVTFKVLNPLVEAGRLPNIKRLIQNGATSRLYVTGQCV